MKNYELLTIFKPNLEVEEIDKNLSKMEETIKGYKGKVLETDKIGRKKLAFDIQKFRDGFFVSTILSIPAEQVAEFKRMLRLNDSILRTMFLDVTKKYAVK